ncbi:MULTISPECIES: hypothetical protein [unclassified Bradyrhizobium]
MIQAKTRVITPPLNSSSSNVVVSTADGADSSRRAFLAQAAAVAAGAAALGAALPVSGSAAAAGLAPDSILQVIEKHKAAYAAYGAAIDHSGDMEREVPKERRRSDFDASGEEIFETDDPRWIESQRAVSRTSREVDEVAIELLNVRPTTLAGLCALVRYAIDHDVDGMHWPARLEDGDIERSWHYFLLESILEVLPALGGHEQAGTM